jgi:ubiquinone/menaquinone biosynthesis C-methylase UbiE
MDNLKMTDIDYSTVTERAGDEISQEQLERLCHRYYWAGSYCDGKDVTEVACGTGPGLGYLLQKAESLCAGDYTPSILAIAQEHYKERLDLRQFDAQAMPYEDQSMDVLILFEAIYYLPDILKFIYECRRVLRSGGRVLIATANKDLYDFNPSPYTHAYYGVVELHQLFEEHRFDIECFGHLSVQEVSIRQRILRPIKGFVVKFGLMPKSMVGKKLLKRLVFGEMIPMPAEIQADMITYESPTPLSNTQPDQHHKVIYCVATLRK